jgi:hypothetical protein
VDGQAGLRRSDPVCRSAVAQTVLQTVASHPLKATSDLEEVFIGHARQCTYGLPRPPRSTHLAPNRRSHSRAQFPARPALSQGGRATIPHAAGNYATAVDPAAYHQTRQQGGNLVLCGLRLSPLTYRGGARSPDPLASAKTGSGTPLREFAAGMVTEQHDVT